MRGYVFYQQKNFDAAVRDLTIAVEKTYNKDDKFNYYWRAMAYDKLGKSDLAAADRAKYNAIK